MPATCSNCGDKYRELFKCTRCQFWTCDSCRDDLDGVCDECAWNAGEMEDRADRRMERQVDDYYAGGGKPLPREYE